MRSPAVYLLTIATALRCVAALPIAQQTFVGAGASSANDQHSGCAVSIEEVYVEGIGCVTLPDPDPMPYEGEHSISLMDELDNSVWEASSIDPDPLQSLPADLVEEIMGLRHTKLRPEAGAVTADERTMEDR